MVLAQRLIGDLQKAGADVVTEDATIPEAQFLSFLQQELPRCQWFILVQTPQTMDSGRAQMAVQEALQQIKSGSLRGAVITWSSSDGWDMPTSWSEMGSYAYNGDYPRLHYRLLLDLNLLQITGMLGEVSDEATVRMLPLSQSRPGFYPQATESRKPVPFWKRGKELFKLSGSFHLPALHLPALSAYLPQIGSTSSKRETRSGDRPVAPPRFSPSSPRFWLYSIVSVCSIIVVLSTFVLVKGMSLGLPFFAHSTPVAPNHLTLPHPGPTQSSSPSPITVQDAGHVFIATGVAPVFNQSGKPVAARCSMRVVTASVSVGQDVVVLDNHGFQIAGQTYLHVAYPDPCILGLDYSSNAAIANGTGAVGWVEINALAVTHVVRPIPEFKGGAIWRDCWTPDRCANVGYPNVTDTLSAKDAVLFAWNTGSYWDVHWWHVRDKGGKEASVYARDWGAFSM
jgi:hypothetical protein